MSEEEEGYDLAHACSGDGSPEDDDYENKVGHGQPPKHTRWTKGMPSPNQHGRPRKKTSQKYFLEQIATRPVWIKADGRSRQVAALEAMITLVKLKAIQGHAAASRICDNLRGIGLDDELDQVPKAVLVVGEKMTQEEWEVEAAAYLAGQPSAFTGSARK